MLESLCCRACRAHLEPEDSHDLCPSCLGADHLREGFSYDPRVNCSNMPCAVCTAHLAAMTEGDQTEGFPSDQLLPGQPVGLKHCGVVEATTLAPRKRLKKEGSDRISARMDQMTAELAWDEIPPSGLPSQIRGAWCPCLGPPERGHWL